MEYSLDLRSDIFIHLITKVSAHFIFLPFLGVLFYDEGRIRSVPSGVNVPNIDLALEIAISVIAVPWVSPMIN